MTEVAVPAGAAARAPGAGPLPRVSVVIPVTHADAPVAELVHAYGQTLTAASYPHEFVFVLDGVRGGVAAVLERLAETQPVQIVRLQGTGLGESIALSAGVERSAGEFIVNAPQYLQAEPEDLVKIVQTLERGADCVATWRHPRVDPWLNQLQSRLFNWCLRTVLGVKFHDLNSSLRGLRRHVLSEVNVYGDLYRFLPVLAQRQGFQVVEIKVRHREERGRSGFYGLGVYARRVLDVVAITFLTRFTQKPLRFFGMLGFASILLGIALCIYPLWIKLSGEGGLSTSVQFMFGVLGLAFGVQLIGFGLVGEIIIFTHAPNLRDYQVEDEPPRTDQGVAAPPRTAAAAGPAQVREILPGEDARWDAYVRAHGQGTPFHRSGWRKVVEDTFRHEPHCLLVESGREVRGVLPLFRVRSPFLGRQLISSPYAVYGGILANGEAEERLLLDAAAQLGRRLGVGYVELRHLESLRTQTAGCARERSELYVTFRKVLPEDPQAILPAIPKKARAEVRRARDKFGIGCRETQDLDVLFDLFARNKRRLGSPSLPRRWFRALADEFGRAVVVHEAHLPGGEPLAAVLSFLHGDTIYAYYSGSREDQHRTGVMDFIYCRIMEWGAERGFRVFDFGRSRKDSGAAAFKRNMGFDSVPLAYDYLLLGAGARVPEFHPSNPKLALPRRIWAGLPLGITKGLGGWLSRYIP